jgi:hypothetical protein
MTTLENRPNTALLVVDVQNGVEGAHESDAVVANIGSLVEKARQEQTRRWSGTPTRRRIRRPAAPPPDQVIAHTNLYWTYEEAPGRTAGTVETKAVDFGGAS